MSRDFKKFLALLAFASVAGLAAYKSHAHIDPAGALGIALGPLIALQCARSAEQRGIPVDFPCLLAVAFAFAIGVFFGFYPARKAARLHPVAALSGT